MTNEFAPRKAQKHSVKLRMGFWVILLVLLACWMGCLKAHSQELPEHPQPQSSADETLRVQVDQPLIAKPSFIKRAATYTVSNDHYLIAIDSSLRALDMKTTHDLLSNHCHCFKEDDPIAPHDGNYAKQVAFQGGMAALVTFGHYELAKHNHLRWARVLVLGDIASETYAVGHNMSLALPKPLPAVPIVASATPEKGAFQ